MKNLKTNYIITTFLALFMLFSNVSYAQQDTGKVGVFFGSYGDVDAPEELKDLVTNTLSDPDVLPLPNWLRFIVSRLAYTFTHKDVLKEYEAIGYKSNMRLNSQLQADLVAQKLSEAGYDAVGYRGFTMTFPYVDETLAQAQEDGIETLVVFYQGAQYSQVTAYIVFREVEKYILAHPEWDVNVVGVKSFSDDTRFVDLIVERIDNRMQSDFPGIAEEDICIFLPMHGNVMSWIEKGDPSYDQMMRAVHYIEDSFPDSYVSHGFQNHDELPFVKWTQPNDDTALDLLAQQQCSSVISNGMISFTTDSLETLYDHSIGEREAFFEFADRYGLEKEFIVEGMFNDDPKFAELMKDIAIEAINKKGDLVDISGGDLKSLSLR